MAHLNPSCAQCRRKFSITEEDSLFYKKMTVPPPTWCPSCRLRRRMVFTNERTLYASTCGLCTKNIITMYHPSAPFPVYCKGCWWGDGWNPLDFGQNYDFSRPFFEQFHELKNNVPRCNLVQEGVMEGSAYCNRATNNKNCYLCFRSTNNEDCMYSHPIVDSHDCVDCYNIQKSGRCYECSDCLQMYNCRFCKESQNCTDSMFLYDCRGCSNCFGGVNLRNQQYHIFNKPYSPEEYQRKVAELLEGSSSSIDRVKKEFAEFSLKHIRPSIVSSRSEDVSGNWIYDSKNVKNSFMCRNVENGDNLFFIIQAKDCKDFFHFGRDCELIYETSNCGLQCSNIAFCNEVFSNSSNLRYCDGCFSASNSFGCVGIRKESYSILNKQYTEDEYNALIPKIIEHMNAVPYRNGLGYEYRFGSGFPPELSPMCYNETVAQEFFPLTRDEAIQQGYRWRDQETKDIAITKPASAIPEVIVTVDDSILKEIIGCAHEGNCQEQCTRGFKIMRKELEFYHSLNLPLPRLCPNCRHYQRHKERPSIFLHQRSCACTGSEAHTHGAAPCQNTFETVYSSGAPEVVYCPECYQSEIV